MTDRYAELVRSGPGSTVAQRLGLPRPAILRRTDPGSVDVPLVPGPVVVVAADDDESRGAAAVVAAQLSAWGAEVSTADGGTASGTAESGTTQSGTRESGNTQGGTTQRGTVQSGTTQSGTERLGAIVVVLTGVEHPDALAEPMLAVGHQLRRLAPGGRLLTFSRAAAWAVDPDVAAAREAVEGILRSAAKELRRGATGNGIVLDTGVGAHAPSAQGALRFLLSARSAFVSGQLLLVGSARGEAPADWTRPLEGRVAVVTGAARGIGAAIARVLARDGADVVAVDLPASGEALASVANEVGGMAVQLDITADDATERLLGHVLPRYDRLDIVVHNAGTLRDKLLANMSREKWELVLAVNLGAQLRINEKLLASDALGAHARLVSLASTSGIAGNRGQTNYAASKAGIMGMTRALEPIMAERGGTANAVAPGFIETDMTASIPALAREVARRANSLSQGGLPVDVAEAIAFLVSPQAGGINGQTLRVCGQYAFGR